MKKVMLVDDEILIRERFGTVSIGSKEGFVYCGDASDGELALPIIEQLSPDIFITDIKMPFMNGLRAERYCTETVSGYENYYFERT